MNTSLTGISCRAKTLLAGMLASFAAAGADFEYVIVRAQLERLQDTAFDRRRHHELAMPERNFRVGERKGFVRCRDEILARHSRQYGKNGRIQHRPRADLLVNHLLSCEIDVHTSVV